MAKRTSSDGKDYEKLAESIFKKIYATIDIAQIQRDIRLDSKYGKRQFDVVVTNAYEGCNISVIVECKDYATPVDIACIEGYISKLDDFDVKQKFIISKSGFTKQALNKASDNLIYCCTAQEAQHPEWNIDTYIPVFLTETFPRKLNFHYNLDVKPKESFSVWTINGVDLKSQFKERWEQGFIDPTDLEESEVVKYLDVERPFLMEYASPNGGIEHRDVGELSVKAVWHRRYYKSSLNEVKKTQLLKYSGCDGFHILLNKEELSDYEFYMEEIQADEMEYSKGIILLIYSKPGIEFNDMKLNDFIIG